MQGFARVLAGLLPLALSACQQGGPSAEQPKELAAEVDGQAISVAELDERIKQELFESRAGSPAKLYDLRSDMLEQMIRERLLDAESKRRGVPPEAVVELEIKDMGPVSEEEVTAPSCSLTRWTPSPSDA